MASEPRGQFTDELAEYDRKFDFVDELELLVLARLIQILKPCLVSMMRW